MKKNLFSIMLTSLVLLFSCTKEKIGLDKPAVVNPPKDGTIYGRTGPDDPTGDCALTPFASLASLASLAQENAHD